LFLDRKYWQSYKSP